MRKKEYPKNYYTYHPYEFYYNSKDNYIIQIAYDNYFDKDMIISKKAMSKDDQGKFLMASPDLEKEFDSLIEGMFENIHAKEVSGEITAVQSIKLVELVRARVVGAERVGGFDDGFAENLCNCISCKAERVRKKENL